VQTVKSTRIPQISPFLAMFACAPAFSRALFSRIFSTLQTSFDSAPSQNPAPSSRSISCRLRHCLASAWVMKLSDSSASWACLRFFLTTTLFVSSGSGYHEILHSGSINLFHKGDITVASHVVILRCRYDEAHEPKRPFDPCIHRVILISDARVLRTNQRQRYGQCTTENLLHPPCNGCVTHCPPRSNKLRPDCLRSVLRRTFVDPLPEHAWYGTIHNLDNKLFRCLATLHQLLVRQGGICSPVPTGLRLHLGFGLDCRRRGSKRNPIQCW
jgi:hypothetical protein